MIRLIAAFLLITSSAWAQTVITADNIPCGSQPFTLYATSDGNTSSPCKFNTSDVAYGSMSGTFSGNGTSYHTTSLTLTCAASYSYYVRCDGDTAEATPSALRINFSVLADTAQPTVTITTNSGNNYNTAATPQTIAGTATDDVAVSSVSYVNSLGGSGACTYSSGTFSCDVAMVTGDNVITVTALDAALNSGSDAITITYSYTPAGSSSRNTVGVKKFSGGKIK